MSRKKRKAKWETEIELQKTKTEQTAKHCGGLKLMSKIQ